MKLIRKRDLKYAILATGLLSISVIGGICKVNANGEHGYTAYEVHGTGDEAQVGYSGFEPHFASHAQSGYSGFEPHFASHAQSGYTGFELHFASHAQSGYTAYEVHGTGDEAQVGYSGFEPHFASHAQSGYTGFEPHFASHAQPGYSGFEPVDRETLIQRIIGRLRNLSINRLIGLDMLIND
ncbi:MAG: hypothetical protein LBL38_01280 [Lactobacillales bacterium]|jgi:hypothetical protein|nr:hypothetical protein [Lactobacillales bacterium]